MQKHILFLVSLFFVSQSYAQVTIITNAIPPAQASINQYITAGKITCQLINTSPPGSPSLQILVYGKIECLAPAPFTIALNPNFAQHGTVVLAPGTPVNLPVTQQLLAFGSFNAANLQIAGIDPASIMDANGNLKLPSGTYRVCFAARQIDPASGQPGAYVSDPNLGCGNFGICTQAAAPQFTQPVSNFNIDKGSAVMVQKNFTRSIYLDTAQLFLRRTHRHGKLRFRDPRIAQLPNCHGRDQ